MGSILLKDFKGGLDTRRLPETSAGGTLLRAYDCHITSGGEAEQRADFVKIWTQPTGASKGLAATPEHLVIFGHASAAPAGKPGIFHYTQLPHPTGEQLVAVPSWDTFGPDVVSAAIFADGSRYLFVDDDRVTDTNVPKKPRAVLTANRKLNVGSGTVVYFSAVSDADNFTGTGYGFVDMAFELTADATVVALEHYEGNVAVFFDQNVMVWFFDPDPNESSPIQRLGATGALSSRSVVPYLDGDLVYYAKTGIRSLRARDSSKSAMTVDIGSAIDTLTQAEYAKAAEGMIGADGVTLAVELTTGVVDPRTGRLWMAINDQIFVLSNYPATKVTAWSIYRPGFNVDAMAVWNDRIFLRSGDDFYVYGGLGDPVYSADTQAEVWLPYLDANAPAQRKALTGIDAACRGVWEVRVGFDPENLGASDLVGRVAGTTYGLPTVDATGGGTHISLRFKVLSPANSLTPAVLSAAMIHHDLDDQADL